MKLAFIMPAEAERVSIERMRESIIEMRPDQIRHLEHLLRSWGIFGSNNAIADTWRAIKRVLRDRP